MKRERFVEIMEIALSNFDKATTFEQVANFAIINELAEEVLRLRSGLDQIAMAKYEDVDDLVNIAKNTLGEE